MGGRDRVGALVGVFWVSMAVLLWMGRGIAVPSTAEFGDYFPDYAFQSPGTPEDRAYLGLGDATTFAVPNISADLIVVEVLNTYCTSCQMQAPIYNEVVRLLDEDPTTKGRIKWIAVGVGNNETEVASFRNEKGVPFPLLTDKDFKFYDAVGGAGGVRTPLTILVRRDDQGRGIVVDSHVGFRREKEEIVEEIKAALQYDLAYLKIKEGERAVLPVTEKLEPPLSEEDLELKIREALAIDGASVIEVRRIVLKDDTIYLAKVEKAGAESPLFARVVSRPPVCDICHDIHFIYVFDARGGVRNFVPIHLTKYGNRLWSEEDVEKMRGRLVGRSILDPFPFDRDVDAVSRATISSVVIFDAMNKGKSIYADLMKEGYMK